MMETKQSTVSDPLAGYGFHIFGGKRKIVRQGTILKTVGSEYALVQFFNWVSGEPSSIELVTLKTISYGSTLNLREAGSWKLYETVEDMDSWYENNPETHD